MTTGFSVICVFFIYQYIYQYEKSIFYFEACFIYTSAQLDIANLLLSLKVIPFEALISAVTDTLKEASVKATKVGIQIEKVCDYSS